MKKSLIALAVLAGATAANADTTLYGQLNAGYSLYDTYYDVTAEDVWTSKVVGSGKFGIKGHEDLGNGLKAIYKMEFGFNVANIRDTQHASVEIANVKDGKVKAEVSKGTLYGRYAWVGFKGESWGQLTLGTQLTAPGDLGGAFGLTVNAMDHYYLDDGMWLANNSIRYVSPEFSGFQFQGTIAMDGKGVTSEECATANCTVTNRNHNDQWSVGASYSNNGFDAILAYAQVVDVAHYLTTSFGYSNDQFAVGVNADYREDFGHESKAKLGAYKVVDGAETWSASLNGKYNVTKMDSIRAAVGVKGSIEDDDKLSEDNPYFVSLSYMHKFSKRTSLRAGYTFEDTNADSKDSDVDTSHNLTVTVRHNF